MSDFDLGQQVVSRAMLDGTAKPFLDQGWDLDWATDPENVPKFGVFQGTSMDAWKFILGHYAKYGRLPNEDIFHVQFPAYDLLKTPATPDELIDLASREIQGVAIQDAMGDLQEFLERQDYESFSDRASRLLALLQTEGRRSGVVDIWDEAGHNIDALLNRQVKFGIGTGIPEIDGQEGFIGFQPGNLITYLGRAKAGKTSFALLSGLDAAMVKYKRIMVVTVEISAANIHDRLDAYAAKVGLTRLVSGKLTPDEKRRVERTYEDRGEYEPLVYIVEPGEKYTVTDLEADIDRYEPEYVIIDGFYFMTDRNTGKSGGSWEGHDGLAADLKRVAMRRKIVVLVTHQVREKQLGGKKGNGIDDGAMMGGTGLIMASDMVLGLDVNEDHIHKISCTRSRTGYLKTIQGEWDWERSEFRVLQDETYEG